MLYICDGVLLGHRISSGDIKEIPEHVFGALHDLFGTSETIRRSTNIFASV